MKYLVIGAKHHVGLYDLGQVPEAVAGNLERVGAWLNLNGASIYGCGAAGLPQPKWGRITARGGMLSQIGVDDF